MKGLRKQGANRTEPHHNIATACEFLRQAEATRRILVRTARLQSSGSLGARRIVANDLEPMIARVPDLLSERELQADTALGRHSVRLTAKSSVVDEETGTPFHIVPRVWYES